MYQPDELKTDDYLIWSRGSGNDVWRMLKASADGDLAAVQTLFAKDPALLECEYQYYKPLHFAVRENRLEVVRFLLDHGADPMGGGMGFRPVFRPGSFGDLQ